MTNLVERGEKMEDCKLYDAEYRLMDLVWQLEPVNSTALAKRCTELFGWNKSTAFNLIRKLSGRGFLRNEQATVTTLVGREDVMRYESRAVVEKSFGGSLPAFVAAFLNGRKLTGEETEQLRKMIEEAGDE